MSRPVSSNSDSIPTSGSFGSSNYVSAKSAQEIDTFTDPLINLLHSKDLNKDKELSEELYQYIDDISDNELKAWCIDSLTVLRNLEKIELKLNDWEFHTLDFTIEIESNKAESNNPIQEKLAFRVLEKSNLIRSQLVNEKSGINQTIQRSRMLSINSPAKVITDAGTILIELTLRIVKLGKQLDELVTIGYSRSKLTLIGLELKRLVNLNNFSLDIEVVKNYKNFVNNLLTQLNIAVAHNDTVNLWETFAIVNDVEKMFESMKRKSNLKNDFEASKLNKATTGKNSMKPDLSTLDEDMIANNNRRTRTTDHNTTSIPTAKEDMHKPKTNIPQSASSSDAVAKISAKEIFNDDSDLYRTKITEHMPSLMQAFHKNASSDDDSVEHIIEEKDSEINVHESGSEEDNVSDDESAGKDKGPTSTKEKDASEYFLPSFKPSLFNSFFQPTVKGSIYINAEDVCVSNPSSQSFSQTSLESRPNGVSNPNPIGINKPKRNDIQNMTLVRKTVSNDESSSNSLVSSVLLMNLEQRAEEDEARNKLLKQEQRLKDKELLLEKSTYSLRSNQSDLSSSSMLSHVSSSILSKTLFNKPIARSFNDVANSID